MHRFPGDIKLGQTTSQGSQPQDLLICWIRINAENSVAAKQGAFLCIIVIGLKIRLEPLLTDFNQTGIVSNPNISEVV